jgi:hypothetical protein
MNAHEFAAAEAEAAAAIVRRQWFDGPALDPRPLYEHRIGIKPGTAVEQEPKLKIGAWHWGLDRDGRPRVGHQHVMKKMTQTMVYQHLQDGARVIEFVHNPEQHGVFAVSDVRGSLSRPREIVRTERDALIRETYAWDGDRLTQVVTVRECPLGREVLRRIYDVAYAANGDVTIAHRFADDPTPAVAPLAKQEIDAFAKALEDRLTTALMRAVQQVKVRGPVYCLILAYDCDLPPLPALGTDEQRKRWRKEHGEDAKDYVWNPAEFEHYETDALQLDDDGLLADCQRLATAWRSSDAKVRKFVNGLARRLAEGPWPAKLKRTDDFVIVATDLEGADLPRNMREVIPPGRLKTLRDNGWLS